MSDKPTLEDVLKKELQHWQDNYFAQRMMLDAAQARARNLKFLLTVAEGRLKDLEARVQWLEKEVDDIN